MGKINGKKKGREDVLRVLVEYRARAVVRRSKNHPRGIGRNFHDRRCYDSFLRRVFLTPSAIFELLLTNGDEIIQS